MKSIQRNTTPFASSPFQLFGQTQSQTEQPLQPNYSLKSQPSFAINIKNAQPKPVNGQRYTNNNNAHQQEQQTSSSRKRRYKIFVKEQESIDRRFSKSAKDHNKSLQIYGGQNKNSVEFANELLRSEHQKSVNQTETNHFNSVKFQSHYQCQQPFDKSSLNHKKINEMTPIDMIAQRNEQYAQSDRFQQHKYKNAINQQFFRVQLERKQQQIKTLKLELQRYQRCETINKQNQQIYKRLVQKLKLQKNSSVNHSFSPKQKQDYSSNYQQYQADAKLSHLDQTKQKRYVASDTTRFLHPQTTKNSNQTQREMMMNNVITPIRMEHEIQSLYQNKPQFQSYVEAEEDQIHNYPKHSQNSSNAMTFNKQKLKEQNQKEIVMPLANPNMHKIQKPKYYFPTSTKHHKVPIQHKLSQINKSLWEKHNGFDINRKFDKGGLGTSFIGDFQLSHHRARVFSTKNKVSMNFHH